MTSAGRTTDQESNASDRLSLISWSGLILLLLFSIGIFGYSLVHSL